MPDLSRCENTRHAYANGRHIPAGLSSERIDPEYAVHTHQGSGFLPEPLDQASSPPCAGWALSAEAGPQPRQDQLLVPGDRRFLVVTGEVEDQVVEPVVDIRRDLVDVLVRVG